MRLERLSDGQLYFTVVGIICSIALFAYLSHTIFPFMDDDEYFIDKYGCIHGKNCPRKSVPWFTIKHSKYDFLIEEEQEICSDCLYLEEEKLMMLHKINLKEEILRLKRIGVQEDYIKSELRKYKFSK